MKHSLTSPSPVIGLFDLLASGLAGSAAGRTAAARRDDPPRSSLLERIEHALWLSRQRETERFLAGSVDIADLEGRLRQLERRAFHRFT